MRPAVPDVHSNANVTQIVTEHIHLVWTVHLDKQILEGSVELRMKTLVPDVQQISLDTRGLDIAAIHVDGAAASHALGAYDEVKGTPLLIPVSLPEADTEVRVKIEYNTTSQGRALQWLRPEQTEGKIHPYVFTQCQALHARSLLPCQDAPQVKFTYTAKVVVDSPLVAVMSALLIKSSTQFGKSLYNFDQPTPMPSYLMALAVGQLESRSVGPRTLVYAEPKVVERAAHEFALSETYLQALESIVGPYQWRQCNILCMPPSFPFGGMENPCLLFVTPTLLAGDRSLAAVIIHEIAHSWTGNLVTNQTWTDFWFNEGCTVFLERKVIGRLFGEQEWNAASIGGMLRLRDSLMSLGYDNPVTWLTPNLSGIDPDDAYSTVPYEKGYLFQLYLEELAGGPAKYEPWFKELLARHARSTINADEFYAEYTEAFPAASAKVDWASWWRTPGNAPVPREFDRTLLETAEQLAAQWLNGIVDTKNRYAALSPVQKVAFTDYLLTRQLEFEKTGKRLNPAALAAIEDAYHLSQATNSEVLFRWCRIGIRAEYPAIVPVAHAFLKSQGRGKFVKPLFADLCQCNRVSDAQTIFQDTEAGYHPIISRLVRNLLNKSKDAAPVTRQPEPEAYTAAPGSPVRLASEAAGAKPVSPIMNSVPAGYAIPSDAILSSSGTAAGAADGAAAAAPEAAAAAAASAPASSRGTKKPRSILPLVGGIVIAAAVVAGVVMIRRSRK